VAWSAGEGLLKWDVTMDELTNLKAIQPKLKLHIVIHSANSSESSPAGYVLIDMRDLSRGEIKSQAFKTHGMNGGEMVLSAKMNTPSHVAQNPTHAKVIGSSSVEALPADNAR
tara:strand:- start:270 stop:608 length:339 start_codon:yes stop_codon:yes gene_type:complete